MLLYVVETKFSHSSFKVDLAAPVAYIKRIECIPLFKMVVLHCFLEALKGTILAHGALSPVCYLSEVLTSLSPHCETRHT